MEARAPRKQQSRSSAALTSFQKELNSPSGTQTRSELLKEGCEPYAKPAQPRITPLSSNESLHDLGESGEPDPALKQLHQEVARDLKRLEVNPIDLSKQDQSAEKVFSKKSKQVRFELNEQAGEEFMGTKRIFDIPDDRPNSKRRRKSREGIAISSDDKS